MATRTLQYGDYVFPNTFHVADDGLQWSIPQNKVPRADGGRILDQYLQPKRVLVRGGFIRGPLAPTLVLRDELDDLKAALEAAPARLYLYDDRYYRCVEVEEFRNPYDATHYGRMAIGIEIPFLAPDPCQYELTEVTDTWTSPADSDTRALPAVGGNFYARPKFTITVDGGGATSIAFTLTNTTTSEAFTLTGDVTGGDVIVVDTLLETVKIGSSDYTALFDGRFPRLDVGANTLQWNTTAGAATSVVTAWLNRWL